MDRKKIAGILIILLLLIVGSYQFVYLPYQEEQARINFNNGLINASNIENDSSKYEKYDFENSTDINDMTLDMNNMHKEMKPQIQEIKNILNDTIQYANNNETKIKYVELQIKRIEKTEISIDNMVKTVNEMNDALNNNDELLVLALYTRMQNETVDDINEYKDVQEEVKTLLKNNPDLNSSLRQLNLYYEYYGEMNMTDLEFT